MTYERRLIARGAEAEIYLERWLGLTVILKVRVAKRYRIPEVDQTIRKRRTVLEAKCMIEARDLIRNVPRVLDVDVQNCVIRMEYVEGISLRDLTLRTIRERGELSREVLDYFEVFGMYVGKLHQNGIIHGDLALTNVLVHEHTGKPYLIDFGLSYKHSVGLVEPVDERTLTLCARDINVFFRNVEATFAKYRDVLIAQFLKGYENVVGSKLCEKVVRQVKKIRSLARYVIR